MCSMHHVSSIGLTLIHPQTLRKYIFGGVDMRCHNNEQNNLYSLLKPWKYVYVPLSLCVYFFP